MRTILLALISAYVGGAFMTLSMLMAKADVKGWGIPVLVSVGGTLFSLLVGYVLWRAISQLAGGPVRSMMVVRGPCDCPDCRERRGESKTEACPTCGSTDRSLRKVRHPESVVWHRAGMAMPNNYIQCQDEWHLSTTVEESMESGKVSTMEETNDH